MRKKAPIGRAPNYKTQQLSVCLGCQFFIINRSHLSFWKYRYSEYSNFLTSDMPKSESSFAVIRKQAEQAKNYKDFVFG
jgi:hypothetical protein